MDLRKHGTRVKRLKELDNALAGVREKMQLLVGEINQQLGRPAGAGRPVGTAGLRRASCRARMHVYGGVMTIRYDVTQDGKPTTRSGLVNSGPDGAGLSWIVEIGEERQTALLALDQARRILNHQYRLLFAERRSLRQLHQEEKAIKAGRET